MRIECSDCSMYRSEHCHDCLVTAVLHPPATAVEIDEELESPLEVLSRAGLIPVLKFRSRDASPAPPGGEGADDEQWGSAAAGG